MGIFDEVLSEMFKMHNVWQLYQLVCDMCAARPRYCLQLCLS